LVVRFAVAELA